MSREPKVVIVDTSALPTNESFKPSSIFDESDDGENAEILDDDRKKDKKPPGPIALFFMNNKSWVITIGVLLLTIIALSLTIYFVNIKCNNTVREERDRANRMINELEERSASSTTARDRYCEEAQRLRSQLRELSTEYDRLKNAPPPKAVNKLHQKKMLQEYNGEDEEPARQRKHKKVTFAQDDEAISVDLPKPSTSVRKEVEEAVTLNALNGANDMDAVVTAPDDEFDEDVIDM